MRTWVPRGHTPVLQYHFNWHLLSAMAGITWWNFYFRLYPGTIHATEVIDFLGHLLRHLPGKLLVGNPAFRVDPFKVADQQQPEVPTRRQARPSHHRHFRHKGVTDSLRKFLAVRLKVPS